MNPTQVTGLVRWVRFNVVGLAGMLVQLVTLAGLNHIVRGHYLLFTAIAVETAVLHNFVAHVHYTWRERHIGLKRVWRERRGTKVLAGALWRFQVSNGAVSLVGNVLLMRLLVSTAHLPVVVANVIAIVVCGLANFWLGDAWAFARRAAGPSKRLCRHGLALLLVLLQVGLAAGQETPPASPEPTDPAPVQQSVVLSPAAQKVKDAVGRIGEDCKITVHMLNRVVYHGRVGSTGADRFTVHEVDLAQTVPIRYDEVQSVKANYGGKGFAGRRPDPMQQLVIGAIIVAGLLGTVILAVASDKS